MTASGRTLSRLARVTARGHAGDTWLLPACERWSQDGWPDVKPRRVLRRLPLGLLWFLKRRRLSLLLQEGRFSPRFRLICRVLQGVFEPVRILFPVAIGGFAGMTASAAGSGGAVCPSTAAVGAVIFFFFFFVYGCAGCWVWVLLCPSTSAAGAVTVGAATAMPAGAGGPPAPATVHGVPGVSGATGVPGVPGPMHCQVTFLSSGCRRRSASVGSTGETWRSPSPVASSRRSGGSTGLPRFEILDQVFLPPASGRSFIGGASAWFFLPLWLTAVSLACGLAFAVPLGGGGFPLLRGRRSAPSHIPWPLLDLTLVLSRCKNLAWLVSWRWWLVLG